MKRYVTKQATDVPPASPAMDEPGEAFSSFDVLTQLSKLHEVLNREVRNLMAESSRGKLSQASSRDLVNYLNLLNELKEKSEKELGELTDEQLQKLVK